MKHLPILLVVSLLTCCVEVDISVPSFPDISDYFDISDGLTQMTIALNFFGFCVSSIFYGPLSDAYGRRKIMIYGNAIMMVGAIGCFLSNSIELLLFSRFIQGLGASTSAVVAFAMVADAYNADKASGVIGIMNSLITVFMSMAPVIGGFINEAIGWRGNYATIAAISVISWIMIYYWLPETKEQKTELSVPKITNDFITLFCDKRFLYTSIMPSIIYSGWMSFVACASFLYIETYDLPIMYYALHQGTIVAVFSIFSIYSGRIIDTIGQRKGAIYGITFHIVGTTALMLTAIFADRSAYLTTIAMSISSIGIAVCYPIIFAQSLDIFPDIKGTASSAIMAMRALMCGIFIAFSSAIYYGELITVASIIAFVTTMSTILLREILKIVKFVS